MKTDEKVYKYLARMGRHHMQPFGGGEVQVSDGGLGLSDQDREGAEAVGEGEVTRRRGGEGAMVQGSEGVKG